MKVVIFAGGLGTRLMEETEARPKPMVEIGGKPILWHIMKICEYHGFWKPMNALRDRIELEGLWNAGKSPWKVWQ